MLPIHGRTRGVGGLDPGSRPLMLLACFGLWWYPNLWNGAHLVRGRLKREAIQSIRRLAE